MSEPEATPTAPRSAAVLDLIAAVEPSPAGALPGSPLRWILVRTPFVRTRLAEATTDPADAAALNDAGLVLVGASFAGDDVAIAPALVDAAAARGIDASAIDAAAVDDLAGRLGLPADLTVLVVVALRGGEPTEDADGEVDADVLQRCSFDRYGTTFERGHGETFTFADGIGAIAEIAVSAPPAAVWALATDPGLSARFSDESLGATWQGEPGVGATFVGRNRNSALGEWEIPCTVDHWDPPTATSPGHFGWLTSDPADPGASWHVEVLPMADGTGTWLRHRMVIGPGFSGITFALDAMPDKVDRILRGRAKELQANMQRTVEGVRDLAEAGV
jgi:hypothetical protein